MRSRAAQRIAAVCVSAAVLAVGVVAFGPVPTPEAAAEADSAAQVAAKKKKKKCKKNYKRLKSGKCVYNYFVIKPTSITLVAGSLKKGKFGATGYAYFEPTPRKAILKGFWHISNGLGYQRHKVSWKSSLVGASHLNFTDVERSVTLTGAEMTATLVVQGVHSNAIALKR